MSGEVGFTKHKFLGVPQHKAEGLTLHHSGTLCREKTLQFSLANNGEQGPFVFQGNTWMKLQYRVGVSKCIFKTPFLPDLKILL